MKNKLLTTWIIRTTAASVIAFCVTSLAAGQTRLHPDLGGVSLKLDRLQLSVRLDGRVTTSVPVANKWFYQSNYGFGGLTYDSPVGRLDSLYNTRKQQTFAWYTNNPPSRARNWNDYRLREIRPYQLPPTTPSLGPQHGSAVFFSPPSPTGRP